MRGSLIGTGDWNGYAQLAQGRFIRSSSSRRRGRPRRSGRSKKSSANMACRGAYTGRGARIVSTPARQAARSTADDHWPKLSSTDSLERLNGEVKSNDEPRSWATSPTSSSSRHSFSSKTMKWPIRRARVHDPGHHRRVERRSHPPIAANRI